MESARNAREDSPIGVADPAPRPEPRKGLYRLFWRWHFYAGVLVAPVLVVVAATGGLYIFKAELERLIHPDVAFAAPSSARASLDVQVEAARGAVPAAYRAELVVIPADPARATKVGFEAEGRPYREIFVDPHSGAVRGELGTDRFFQFVLDLHRTLFVGTVGRAVVELMTCWTIVLLLTGLYLWWPRRRDTIRGVLVPRLRAKPYVVLRDLHSLAGFYLLPIALTIAGTGLLYTLAWGSAYRAAADRTGAYAFYEPPRSASPPGATALGLDEASAIARREFPGDDLEVILPREPGRDLVVIASGERGPSFRGGVVLDRATGEIRSRMTPGRLPALGWWSNWNYPLHVGSVLGLPTKALWLVACLTLMALPATGLWMWWERRPRGRTGFPRRPDAAIPRWLAAIVVALGLLLPAVGASLVLILAGEWVVGRIRRPREATSRA